MDKLQEERRDFLRGTRDALDLLRFDAELIEQGVEFIEIVDFAAVYGYAYKSQGTPFLQVPGASEERMFARQQIALQMLFTKYPHPLVLIPPYIGELQNHLRSLELALDLTEGELTEQDGSAIYKEKLSRLIGDSDEFSRYIALRSTRPDQLVSRALFEATLEIGKEFFPELYATVACISVHSTKTLHSLFRDRTLRDSADLLPQFQDMDYSSGATDEWYRRIRAKRKKNRAYQTWTDAMACTYVEVANQQLNPFQKVVLFVSPSSSVDRTLKERSIERPLISLQRHPYVQVVRDLTYCLLASIHRSGRFYDKNLIDENLGIVNGLLRIYESPIPTDWRDDARAAARDWGRCENLFLMSESTATEFDQPEHAVGRDAQFLDILAKLHAAVTEDKPGITHELEQRLSQLRDETVELSKSIPAVGTVDAFK